MKRTRLKWLARGVQVAIVALVLFFVGRTVVRLWPDMAGVEWELSPPLLLAAMGVGIACQGLLVTGWRLSLRVVGATISWEGAVTSQILGQLAKYVPGKVMTLIGKAYLASRAGVPESQATLAMFVEAATQIITGLAVGLAYVVVLLPSERELLPIGAGVVAALLVALHPAVLPRAINAVFGLFGRPPAELKYRWASVVPLAACYLVLWCGWGAGLWLLASGLGISLPAIPLAAGYALSWIVGFLSFIFPGGLGVREYALARLLGPAVESGAAMSIALAARGWILAAELLCAVCVWGRGVILASRDDGGDENEAKPDDEA